VMQSPSGIREVRAPPDFYQSDEKENG
jgi:hypothetical protein